MSRFLTTLDDVKEKMGEVAARIRELGETKVTDITDDITLELNESEAELAKLTKFVEFLESEGIDESIADAMLEHCQYNSDPLQDVTDIISDCAWSAYDDAEAYAREMTECCGFEIPAHIDMYIDYDRMGDDMLINESWAEYGSGIIVFHS